MESVVGIFASREGAEKSVHELLARGVPRHSVIFLTSAVKEKEVESVPTTDAEADGMGETMGVVVGGAAGMSAGLALGSAVASLAVPGVGVIMAAGLGAAAALGIAGGVTGAEIGKHAEHSLDTGVPRDDIAFYHRLLRAGRSLVIVNTEERAKEAREVLDENGAENVEDARKEWRKAA